MTNSTSAVLNEMIIWAETSYQPNVAGLEGMIKGKLEDSPDLKPKVRKDLKNVYLQIRHDASQSGIVTALQNVKEKYS